MGDDMDYDEYGYGFDDPDYIYAEESWDLADELAGNSLPEPPQLHVRDDEWDDYDMYEYFEEIEFGNDDYYDKDNVLYLSPQAGDKRKNDASTGQPIKRRRVELIDFDYPTVLWLPLEEAYSIDKAQRMDPKTLIPYALLPDWRARLKNSHGFATASETKPGSPADDDVNMTSEGETTKEEEWEDEDSEEESGEEGEDEDEDMGGGLDPEVLKRILAAKLAESGIGDADPEAFMHSLMQMMQGGGDDAALEELTSTLLGNASESGNDSATTRWLSKQGVSLLEDEEGTEAEELPDDTKAPTSATKSRPFADTDSPKDSVAGPDATQPDNLREATEPLPPTSVPQVTTTSKKRKKVSFAPPNDRSFSEKEEKQEGDNDDEELALSSQPNTKRLRRGLVAPLPKQTTGKLKSIKSRPTPTNIGGPAMQAKTSISNKSSNDKDTDPEAATAMSELNLAQRGEGTIESRKRKAPLQEPGITEEKPKRQLRNFAAPTASSQRKTSDTNKRLEVGKKPEIAKKSTRSGKERK